MDKAKKRKIKNYIILACIVLIVVILAIMPLLVSNNEQADGPVASILSGTVETGDISTIIHGGGTLAEEDAVELTIPDGVKLKEFLVSNGDVVSEGDSLATVDRVSVMSAITQVQETLDYLVEEMDAASDEKVSSKIVAQSGGKVKLVYAKEGDNVQSVMLEHGALAVLSLDGIMAVEISSNATLSAGDAVTVTLSDGTETDGRVESNLAGNVIITVEDDGYAIDETVTVSDENGTVLGSGELYIHNAWKATAYSGTIDDVNIKAEDTVSAGKAIFTLSDTEYTAKFEMLSAQHREYEELMLELFQLYQSTTLTAPCDGVISGVDEESIYLLSNNQDWTLNFMTNAPNKDDTTIYTNFVGMVAGISNGTWDLAINPTNLTITDYKDLSSVPLDTAAMTQKVSCVPDVPIFELINNEWQQIASSDIAKGDTLLIAGDATGKYIWMVRINKGSSTPGNTPQIPDVVDPSQPSDNPQTTYPSQPGYPIQPGTQYPSGSFFYGGIGGNYSFGEMQEEPEYELFTLQGNTVMAVTPQDTMTLTITLDEQDISKIEMGQTAEIAVDALKNEVFSATVTQIGTSGTNNGGGSKFTVELTLDRSTNMLIGMNATASITLSTTKNILTVPVAALNENGTETVVYTSYDEDTGELGNPISITTGISDGQNVEILSGLENGATYYYAYYDTLELSTDVERGGFPFDGSAFGR